MKDNVRAKILVIYQSQGLEAAKQACKTLMRQVYTIKDNPDLRNAVKGEICETILECFLIDIQKRCSPSILSKSLCIRNPNTGLTTEMDITFFTPNRIYMFECKSYSGDKIITDECTIKTPFISKDVAGQSKHHMTILNEYLDRFRCNRQIKGPSPYKLVLFEYSNKDIKDTRTNQWKTNIPVITIDTIDSWVEQEFTRETKINWNIPAMIPVLQKLDAQSKQLMREHIRRLGAM